MEHPVGCDRLVPDPSPETHVCGVFEGKCSAGGLNPSRTPVIGAERVPNAHPRCAVRSCGSNAPLASVSGARALLHHPVELPEELACLPRPWMLWPATTSAGMVLATLLGSRPRGFRCWAVSSRWLTRNDAMVTDRPYRRGMPVEMALDENRARIGHAVRS